MEKNETIGMDKKEIKQLEEKVNEMVIFISNMAKKMYEELGYNDLNYLVMLSNNLALSFITNFSVRTSMVSAKFVKEVSKAIIEEKKKQEKDAKARPGAVAG